MSKKLSRNQKLAILIGIIMLAGVGTGYFLLKPNSKNNADKGDALTLEDKNNAEISRELQTKYEPIEINTSNVNLTTEETTLLNNDNKQQECYKKLIVKCAPTSMYREKINELLKEHFSITNVGIAYEFLNDMNGSMKDLKGLLLLNQQGKSWSEIFGEYRKKNKDFIPTDFKEGYIKQNVEDGKLDVNDIMIADELAQKHAKTMEELLNLRRDGKSWTEIKETEGIVNLQEKYPTIALSREEVMKYTEEKKMTEEQVVDCLTFARRNNVSDQSVIDAVNSGMSKEQLYAEIYMAEYGF